MRRSFGLTSFLVVALLASAAQADLVEDFWQKVTTGPNAAAVGESIRVVFVTSANIVGTQSQSTYDTFADKSATVGAFTAGLKVVDDGDATTKEWQSLVSANTSNPVQAWVGKYGDLKVFNTNGDYVGTTSTLFSGALSNAIKYDEAGLDLTIDGNASTAVWTGTNSDGTSARTYFGDPVLDQTHMGNNDPPQGSAVPYGTIGDFAKTNNNVQGSGADIGNPIGDSWVEDAVVPFTISPAIGPDFSIQLPIYAMSGEIVAVPEPSTILMWLGFTGVAGLVYWRKRR